MIDQEKAQPSAEDQNLVKSVEEWLQDKAAARKELKSKLADFGFVEDLLETINILLDADYSFL